MLIRVQPKSFATGQVWPAEKVIEDTQAQLRYVNWANVVCTVAHKGKKVEDVSRAILKAGEEHKR